MSLYFSRPALALLIVGVSGSTSFLGNTTRSAAPSDGLAAAATAPEAQPPLPPPPQSDTPPAPAPASEPIFTAAQLETALGPIALYPDALLAQIFAAATYPLDVVQAARWVSQNPDLEKLEEQPWDPSVQALARFKSVLTMMDQNLEWTIQLGDAFRAQPADVMDAVQRLRAKAHAAGSLQSTPQQQVIVDDSAVPAAAPSIRIVPAQPEVIYVPIYDPQVVYVPQVEYVYEPSPAYTVYGGGAYVSSYCPARWYAPVWDAAYIGARWDSTWGFAFSIGYSWGSWSTIDCDWYGGRVCYRDWNDYGWCGWRSDYDGRGHRGGHGGRGGDHDHDDGRGGGRHDDSRDGRFEHQGAMASADGVKTAGARRAATAGERTWRHGERGGAARRTGTFAGSPLVTTAAGPQRPSLDSGGTGVRRAGGGADRKSGASQGVVRLAAPPANIAPPAATIVTPRPPADMPSRVSLSDSPTPTRRGTFSQGNGESPAVAGSSPRTTREIAESQSPVRSSAPSPTVRRGTFNVGSVDVGSTVTGPARPTVVQSSPTRSAQSARSSASTPSRSSSSASRPSSAPRPSAARPSAPSRPSPVMGPTRSSPAAPAKRTGSFSRGNRN